MLRLLPVLVLLAALCANAGCQGNGADRKMQVRVKPDGSMWARADLYVEALGGKVDIEQDGELVVVCIDERCVPLRVPDDAEVLKGKPWARVDRLLQAVGASEAPATNVGLRPGDIAPDFTLESLDGTQVSLSDYRGEKVLVFAWASW